MTEVVIEETGDVEATLNRSPISFFTGKPEEKRSVFCCKSFLNHLCAQNACAYCLSDF
jgi:hypothetical protein